MHRSLLLLLLTGCAASHEPYAWDGWSLSFDAHSGWTPASLELRLTEDGRFSGHRYLRLERCEGELSVEQRAAWLAFIEDSDLLDLSEPEPRNCLDCGSSLLTVSSPDGRSNRLRRLPPGSVVPLYDRVEAFLESVETDCVRLEPALEMRVWVAGLVPPGPSDSLLWLPTEDDVVGYRADGRVGFPDRIPPCEGAFTPAERGAFIALATMAVPEPHEPIDAPPDFARPLYVSVLLDGAYARAWAPLDSELGDAFARAVTHCPVFRE